MKKIIIISTVASVIMFGFSFAIAPLYNALCKVSAIDGRIRIASADLQRNITVEFIATNNENLPWDFYPIKNSLRVHPGEKIEEDFFVKNNTKNLMTVQAVPSFTPLIASKYFHKLECFCFKQQTLQHGESKLMPVVFTIDKNIPANIDIITLAYTLFGVKHA